MSFNDNAPASPFFIVSLDFELHWGVRDVKTVAQYHKNLLGVRVVVPALLATFAGYGIHATWATVGFLFYDNRADLLASLPELRPHYDNVRLSPYLDLKLLGRNEDEDPFHFGRSLINQIRSCPGQEIASHTYSHYYCLEPQQNTAAFRADLKAMLAAAAKVGLKLNSIVFPKNQYDLNHLNVCRQLRFRAFRGNQSCRLYDPRSTTRETRWLRMIRFADSYWNLSSHNCYSLAEAGREPPLNLRASRFLRPYIRNMPMLQGLQERRVVAGMTHAAEHGLVYHLWWHPHNFGVDLEQNMDSLRRILDHFQVMHERFGMKSINMAELASLILDSPELSQDHCEAKDRFARQTK